MIPKKPRLIALLITTALAPLAPVSTASAQTTELEEIKVGASYETEGSNSYTSDLISVGEKSAMKLRQVPQTTSVVTRKQIADGGYTALETAVEDVPGLLVLNNDIGRSSLYSRGFEFDYLYFDGLPAPVSSIYGTQPDLAIVDHVEVLKGPSGLFIGTGSPAGSVNMRLKQANRTEAGGYVTATADSVGQRRIEADWGGALNAGGTLRGRIVAAYADGDGFVQKQENGVAVGYATLAYDLTPDTTLSFSVSKMQRDIAPYNGLPTHADSSLLWLAPDTTTAADWNRFDNDTTDGIAAVEHHLDGGGRLKFSLRNSHQEADFLYAYTGSAANANNVVSRLTWLARDFKQDALALDAHADLPFHIGGWQANAILGVDLQKITATTLSATGNIAGSFDLDDWDVSGVAEPVISSYSTRTHDDITSKGAYAQFRLKPVEALTLIGGARLSWYHGSSTNLANSAVTTTRENGHVTPFAGLTYDVTPDVTLYASYSEIFQAQSYLDASGNILDPLTGGQKEVGVKALLFGGLNVTAAYFDLEQTNRPLAVTGQTYYVADEKVRARGVELEAAGEISENLHLAAGYTYTDTEYTAGPSDGTTFSTVTPQNIFKLSLEYDVTGGALAGWSFGGRLRGVSGFSSRGIEAPGYGVVDVNARKSIGENTSLNIGVSNLFDKEYYSRVGSTSVFNFRGAPRAISISLTQKF